MESVWSYGVELQRVQVCRYRARRCRRFARPAPTPLSETSTGRGFSWVLEVESSPLVIAFTCSAMWPFPGRRASRDRLRSAPGGDGGPGLPGITGYPMAAPAVVRPKAPQWCGAWCEAAGYAARRVARGRLVTHDRRPEPRWSCRAPAISGLAVSSGRTGRDSRGDWI